MSISFQLFQQILIINYVAIKRFGLSTFHQRQRWGLRIAMPEFMW